MKDCLPADKRGDGCAFFFFGDEAMAMSVKRGVARRGVDATSNKQ